MRPHLYIVDTKYNLARSISILILIRCKSSFFPSKYFFAQEIEIILQEEAAEDAKKSASDAYDAFEEKVDDAKKSVSDTVDAWYNTHKRLIL